MSAPRKSSPGERIYLAVMMLGVCLVIFAIASTTGGVS